MNPENEEFSQQLRTVFHQVTEDILLFGPARTHSQQGAACATACALCLLLAVSVGILSSDRPWDSVALGALRDLTIISFLVLLAVVQLVFPRRFLFQRGPSFAVFDRRNQRVYWACDKELVPVARHKVHSTTGTANDRLANQLQLVHRTFIRLRAGSEGDDIAIEIPVFAELDNTNKGIAFSTLALSTLSGFMAQKTKTRQLLASASIADLRRQRKEPIFTNVYRFVQGRCGSSRSGPLWLISRLLLAVPLAAILYLHQVFVLAVRLTSTSAVWPEDLLREIGPLHARSALRALISSKL